MSNESIATHAGTSWTQCLCRAVGEKLPKGGLIVDLGAGRRAPVSRYLLQLNPDLNIVAIDPFESIDAPSGVEVILGDISTLKSKASLILFNPPSTPTRFLIQKDYRYHQFNGGQNGDDILKSFLDCVFHHLSFDGRALFTCPTYFDPPISLNRTLSVVSVNYESPQEMLSRAPIADGQIQNAHEWIVEQVKKNEPRWTSIGVPTSQGKFGIVTFEAA